MATPAINRNRPISAIPRLTQKLELQHPFGAKPLALGLLPFELEPIGVAIERFFQRGDDDTGHPRFELAARTGGDGRRVGLLSRTARLSAESEIGDVE